jgi:hypothetical protein
VDTYTICRTTLDEESAHCRDLYLKTNNTHKKQTYIPQAEFETATPASERPQTYALDRAAIGNGIVRHTPKLRGMDISSSYFYVFSNYTAK